MAPYEADAQLAYLSLNNFIDAVITEDSDLLVFGCTDVLFKMDNWGSGLRVRLQDVFDKVRIKQGKKHIRLNNWSQEKFQSMCILSGCDYLPKKGEGTHIDGIGLKKACAMLQLHDTSRTAIRVHATHYPKKVRGLNTYLLRQAIGAAPACASLDDLVLGIPVRS